MVALNSAPCARCLLLFASIRRTFAKTSFNNGAYAEYIKVPQRIVELNMLTMPTASPTKRPRMVEPPACVLRGLHETRVEIGDTVMVIGGGPLD